MRIIRVFPRRINATPTTNGGDDRNHSLERPIPTLDTSNRSGLVEPLLVDYQGSCKPYPISIPVKTITTKDHFALLAPIMDFPPRLDIHFRMLKNHELKMAQGFSSNYKILGNITEQTKQIGNSVPVGTAKALALSAFGND
jgi:site-specific DNA-cytosine methylase